MARRAPLTSFGTSSVWSGLQFTTSRGGEISTGTMGIFAPALTHGFLRLAGRPDAESKRPLLYDCRGSLALDVEEPEDDIRGGAAKRIAALSLIPHNVAFFRPAGASRQKSNRSANCITRDGSTPARPLIMPNLPNGLHKVTILKAEARKTGRPQRKGRPPRRTPLNCCRAPKRPG